MPATLRVPCIRCGRSVVVATARPLPTCGRCLGVQETWELRLGAERVLLDEAGVRGHLAAGTLSGQEHITDAGRAVPIAAHPRFRAAFLDGAPEALPIVRRPLSRERRRPWWLLGLLGVVAATAAVVSLPEEPAPPPPPVVVAPPPPPEPAPDPRVLPPQIAALLEEIGPVEEPRAILLADAWNAWTRGDRAAATTLAARAVARSHDDVAALSLLASLHAEAGTRPELALELLSRARARDPEAPAVLRAGALAALARNDEGEARRLVAQCLAANDDLGCREASLRIDERRTGLRTSDAENLVYAMDGLAARWPELDGLDQRAALVAARAELLDAEARLDAAIAAGHQDEVTRSARLWLSFRSGARPEDRRALEELSAPSQELLVEAAGDALGQGRPADAVALLARVEPKSATALLYAAQAAVLLGRGGGAGTAALDAARRASEADPTNPSVVQVYAEAAAQAGEAATAATVWDTLARVQTPGPDLGRAWATRAAQDLAANHPREAVIAAEAAVQADPAEPANFLWHAAALVAAQNGPGAVTTLRGAVWAIDGRHSRRRPYGGALPVPPPVDTLRAGLTALLKDDPARANDLAVSLGIVSWLSGESDRAATELTAPVAAAIDPEALLAHARLRLAAGDRAAAKAAVDQALALRPKEATLHLLRADIATAEGRVEDAERALTRARSGQVPMASLRMSELALAEKKADPAAILEARREAAKAAPDDLVARRAWRDAR